MAICLGGKKKRKTGQEVNDIINLNISAACRISFVWSCLFVLITSLYGLVSKKNMETICSVEPNQFPHKPMIVDQEASHHRRANHTSPQHTLPYQTNHTTPYIPHNAMPYHAMHYHTVQRSRCLWLSHTVSSHKKSFSPCRLFYVSPLDLFPSKISFFVCVICGGFWWTTLKYPSFCFSKWLAFFSILKNCSKFCARVSSAIKAVLHMKQHFPSATCRSFFYLIFSFLCL